MIALPPPARSPWQRLYTAAHRRRRRYWAARAERLPLPVWSIGNLHWGGTGKTPVTLAIAGWLGERGVRVAILSRGYGRRGGAPLVVSHGDGPLVTPAFAGDEPWLLAEQLPGAGVAVARRRADAGRLVLATVTPAPQLFLLDDGFSHLRLARDLDLLVMPANDPYGGGRLPPGGRLREPLEAVERAAALLLTGGEAAPGAARAVGAALGGYGFRGAAFACPAGSAAPAAVGTSDATAGEPPGPLLLVTGVARPERVRQAAEAQGLQLAGHLAFRDHCPYEPRQVRRIVAAAAGAGAAGVLTTGKDRVKLAGRLPLPLFELPLLAQPESAFWEWLGGRL
jgi:tetraacyldisaccharide 4'-kinase